jgi:hypothetical protein
MKYRELLTKLQSLSEEKLDMDATVLLTGEDEVVPVLSFITDWEEGDLKAAQVNGILDENHPFFEIQF